MNALTLAALSHNPLSATVDAIQATTGLHAATVATDYGEPRQFLGYLTRADALAAGERFATALGRVPLMPADYVPRVHIGRHGDSRRRDRRQARARKESYLNRNA
jgi:hypothetical protein